MFARPYNTASRRIIAMLVLWAFSATPAYAGFLDGFAEGFLKSGAERMEREEKQQRLRSCAQMYGYAQCEQLELQRQQLELLQEQQRQIDLQQGELDGLRRQMEYEEQRRNLYGGRYK